MPTVTVSAQRLRSMLANRHQSADDVAAAVKLTRPMGSLLGADGDVDFDDLRALAKHFGRPWSYLLIDAPEVFDIAGQDHRSLRNRMVPPGAAMLDHVAAVTQMLTAAQELFPKTRVELPPLPITSSTPPAEAGRVLREFLDVTDERQVECADEWAALRLWAGALQDRGVYVSQRPLHDETIRAFSRVQDGHAVVVVDTADSGLARIFSLLHEYGHVISRSTGICDLDDHSAIERHLNSVAAATLLPAELVESVLGTRGFHGSASDDDDLLRSVSEVLKVSQAAVLIRLRELHVIGAGDYEVLEGRRAARRTAEREARGGNYRRQKIARVGRRYAGEVFTALDDGLIDRQDASALLEIGEHRVRRFRSELDPGTRRKR